MRVSILSLVGLASAAPSLMKRQETDYGFWNATLTTDGGSYGETRDLTAWYYRGALRATTTCHWSYIRGVTTSQCSDNQGKVLTASQFSYTWGEPSSKYKFRTRYL